MARVPFVRGGHGLVLASALSAILLLGLGVDGPVLAASPEPSPASVGDTRSSGEGPGLVGAPFLAIGGVLLLGLVTAGVTLLYVRATPGGPDHGRRRS